MKLVLNIFLKKSNDLMSKGVFATVSVNETKVERGINGIVFFAGLGETTKRVAFCDSNDIPKLGERCYSISFEQSQIPVEDNKKLCATADMKLFFLNEGCCRYLAIDAESVGLVGPVAVDYRIGMPPAEDILALMEGKVFETWSCKALNFDFETCTKSSSSASFHLCPAKARRRYLRDIESLKTIKNTVEFEATVAAARGEIERLACANTYWKNYTKEAYLAEKEAVEMALDGNIQFRYQLLARLELDCLYYLGDGGRNVKHLWAQDVSAHIACMRALLSSFPNGEGPSGITMAGIAELERKMACDYIVHAPSKPSIVKLLNGSGDPVGHLCVENFDDGFMAALEAVEQDWQNVDEEYGQYITERLTQSGYRLRFAECDEVVSYRCAL